MPEPASMLAVVGPAGSGRSVVTDRWADAVRRSTGRSCRRFDAARVLAATDAAGRRWMDDLAAALAGDHALVVDDIQWCTPEMIDRIVAAVDAQDHPPIAVTATGWPNPGGLETLLDLIEFRGVLERTAPLGLDDVTRFVAEHSSATAGERRAARVAAAGMTAAGANASGVMAVEELARVTGGFAALVAAVVERGWVDPRSPLPQVLSDDVMRRVRRQPPSVVEVVELCGLGADLPLALSAIGDDADQRDDLERACRASGLFAEGRPLPLVASAVAADLTVAARARRAAQLLAVGERGSLDATLRANLVADVAPHLDADGPGPHAGVEVDAVDLAWAALHRGDPRAAAAIASVTAVNADAELLRFALDARMLRWERAVERRLDPDHHVLGVLAGALVGRIPSDTALHALGASPARAADPWLGIVEAVVAWSHGDVDTSTAAATRGAEDAHRFGSVRSVGITPAAVAALVSISAGDASHAIDLLRSAIDHEAGGPGEERFHVQLLAFASMQLGEYQPALDLVRGGDDDDWVHRDRLLLAALDVALARRSGDTARLRDGWRRAALLLASNTVSWLFADVLTELLVAGARLGDLRRTGPLHRALVGQLRALPSSGPGATTAAWIDLHLAVGANDLAALPDPADVPGGADRRSGARRAAMGAWRAMAAGRIDEGEVRAAASELEAVDEAWEASRLLGQAALDHTDPARARSLLESARSIVAAPTETDDPLIAAGLSEREAEVARLVADGNTHRDIGAALFVSPKTVEHHVAKIRQRLGAATRAEMLARIRELSDVR